MKDIKIAIDCRLLDLEKNTGISRYTEYIILYYIRKFEPSNILLISNRPIKLHNLDYALTSLRPYNIFHFLLFPFFVKKLNVNVLHSCFYSGLAKLNKNIYTIVTIPDLMYKFVDSFFSKNVIVNFFARKYYDFIVGITLKNANQLISISESTRLDILRIYGLESIVTPLNSNISIFCDDSVLGRFNLDSKNYFFYCGNSRPHKNLSFVISVFEKYEDLPMLVIAGPNNISSTKRILSLGMVNDDELRSLYKNSIAFIFPSYYEGFGMPLVEALRSGTQVIASKIPAFFEFNTPSVHYFELGNVAEFLRALRVVRYNPNVTPDNFFDKYSDINIYKILDEHVLPGITNA